MTSLIASILALGVGPVLHRLLRSSGPMLSLLDGFNFVAISGLILIGVLPDAVSLGGPLVLIFAFAGLLVPAFLERHFKRAGRDSHFVALMLGMLGLCVHSIVDGAALIEMSGVHGHALGTDGASHRHMHLSSAVILHRLPVGLTVWLLLRPRYGFGAASSVLLLVALNTIVGYGFGARIFEWLPAPAAGCFQALVGGSLMHVVFHRPHDRSTMTAAPAPRRWSWYEGIGGILGLGLLALLLGGSGGLLESETVSRMAETFVSLAFESAPALLIAYLLAGVMHSFLPTGSIRWLKRGGAFSQSLRGMAIGLPLPVCSCGVVPLYRTLIERGAPATAAMAFMVATPELGIDAIALSIPLLGVEMTVVRVVAAAAVALLVGLIVGGLTMRRARGTFVEVRTADDSDRRPFAVRVREAAGFGLGELVDNTAPWILLGLGIAALVEPLVDGAWLGAMHPALKVVVFAVLGVPTYVCASGATPFVAVLLAKGVSPGAALAFLLTGPATNVTTFGVVGRLHGRRTAIQFSLAILGLSIGAGLAVNWLLPDLGGPPLEAITAHEGTVLEIICLALLTGIFVLSVLRRGPRRFIGEITSGGGAPGERKDEAHEHAHSH